MIYCNVQTIGYDYQYDMTWWQKYFRQVSLQWFCVNYFKKVQLTTAANDGRNDWTWITIGSDHTNFDCFVDAMSE